MIYNYYYFEYLLDFIFVTSSFEKPTATSQWNEIYMFTAIDKRGGHSVKILPEHQSDAK